MTLIHPLRYPGMTYADVRAELGRELAQREAAYPGMVAKGSMSRGEAHRQLELFRAIVSDCDRFAAAAHARDWPARPADHDFTWHDRRQALQRELLMRDAVYPKWIAKGSLTRAQAALQCRRLQAMLDCYEDGLDWSPRNGGTRPKGHPETPAERAWKHEFDETFFPILVTRGFCDEATAKAILADRYPAPAEHQEHAA